MPVNQTGQNSLLVPPIQYMSGDQSFVDKHLMLVGGNRNLLTYLKFVMNIRIYENELWKKEFGDYFWVLYNRFTEMMDLGLAEELDSTDRLILNIFLKSINCKNLKSQPPQPYFFSQAFSMTPHEYFGLKNQITLPIVKQSRRVSRNWPSRYIGVGYKDKGTAGNDSLDGNPSWRTVSQANVDRSEEISLLIKNLNLSLKPGFAGVRIDFQPCEHWKYEFEVTVYLKRLFLPNGNPIGWKIDNVRSRRPSNFTEEGLSPKFWSNILVELDCNITDGVHFLDISSRIVAKSKADRGKKVLTAHY